MISASLKHTFGPLGDGGGGGERGDIKKETNKKKKPEQNMESFLGSHSKTYCCEILSMLICIQKVPGNPL